jgi:hypothetical protein
MTPLEPRTLLHGAPGTPEPLDALPSGGLTTSPATATVTAGGVPQLSSYSQAPAKLYLQFTGAPSQTWGSYTASAPAFDTDGDPSTFGATEVDQMREIWARVAEKYSPFNVDVTTIDPGTTAYKQVASIVIGGDGAWSGGTYGGLSYVDGFRGTVSNTGWVFPKNLGQGFPKYVAEATAHEAGHLFGLQHQSAYDSTGSKTNEYRGGRDRSAPDPTAPIMGFSYYATRGMWSNGPSSLGPSSLQSDMDVIAQTANGFGYRPDDHGDSPATADLLNVIDGIAASGAGVIERMSDVDVFRFHSDGGLVQLRADVAALGAMLDLKLSLADALGNVLAAADTASLGESVSTSVTAGDYYLSVASHGNYGDVGQYTISGVVPEPFGTPVVVILGVAWATQQRPEGKRNVRQRGRVIESHPGRGGGLPCACAS